MSPVNDDLEPEEFGSMMIRRLHDELYPDERQFCYNGLDEIKSFSGFESSGPIQSAQDTTFKGIEHDPIRMKIVEHFRVSKSFYIPFISKREYYKVSKIIA